MRPALMLVPPLKGIEPVPMRLIVASTAAASTPCDKAKLTVAEVEKVMIVIVECASSSAVGLRSS